MFRSKSRIDHQGVTILSKGTSFSGTLYCRGISRVGGKVEGKIDSEGTLIIEQDAEINADITAETLIIQGTVKGKVIATTKTEFVGCSRLDGHLITPSLEMELGTILNASIAMEDASSRDDSQATPVSSEHDTSTQPAQDSSQSSSIKLVVGASSGPDDHEGSSLDSSLHSLSQAGDKRKLS